MVDIIFEQKGKNLSKIQRMSWSTTFSYNVWFENKEDTSEFLAVSIFLGFVRECLVKFRIFNFSKFFSPLCINTEKKPRLPRSSTVTISNKVDVFSTTTRIRKVLIFVCPLLPWYLTESPWWIHVCDTLTLIFLLPTRIPLRRSTATDASRDSLKLTKA